jgi:hypothetical protein
MPEIPPSASEAVAVRDLSPFHYCIWRCKGSRSRPRRVLPSALAVCRKRCARVTTVTMPCRAGIQVLMKEVGVRPAIPVENHSPQHHSISTASHASESINRDVSDHSRWHCADSVHEPRCYQRCCATNMFFHRILHGWLAAHPSLTRNHPGFLIAPLPSINTWS